jgi:hypothetical protein
MFTLIFVLVKFSCVKSVQVSFLTYRGGDLYFLSRHCVRSNCSSITVCGKCDSYACFGIGKNVMRIQAKPKVPANVSKTCGANIPQSFLVGLIR